MRDLVEKRIREVAAGIATLTGAKIAVQYRRGYPVLVNHAGQTEIAAQVADEVAGRERVSRDMPPLMGAEDFAFMLQARPGAFIFLGNGDSAGWHHPAFDFNDEAAVFGTSYWVRLVETRLPA